MTTTDQQPPDKPRRRAPRGEGTTASNSPAAQGARRTAARQHRHASAATGEASTPLGDQPQTGGGELATSVAQATATSDTAGPVLHLPISQIDMARDNPRGSNPGDVDGLAASIEQVGVLQPVTVTPRDGRFVLVYGHRRLAASTQAGKATIPATVQPMGEVERIVRQTIENAHRKDLTPLQEATAIANLRDAVAAERGGTAPGQRELASMLGVSQSHVSKRLELLELPEPARRAADSGGITLEQAGKLHELVDVGLDKQAASFAKQHVAGQLQDYSGRSTLADRVDAEVKEARARIRQSEVHAVLTAAGTRVVTKPPGGWWSSKVAWIASGQPHGEGYCLGTDLELTEIDVDDHAVAHPEGHAAALCDSHGEAVWVCTDPTVHAETDQRAAERAASHDRRAAEQEEDKERERQLSRAAKAREAFAAELLKRPLKVHASTRDLLADLVVVALDRQESDAVKLTCRLLGLQPVIKQGNWPGAGSAKDYREPVARYADDPSELGRVARAVWLAQGEFRARWTYSPWSPMVVRYLDQLVEAGYTLSPVERQRYQEARQPPTATGQATTGEELDADV